VKIYLGENFKNYTSCFLAKMEEGFKLPLPQNLVVTKSDTDIGKVAMTQSPDEKVLHVKFQSAFFLR
jgi:hypothetical protein